jgi:RNA-directed DNA polymerase
MQAVVKNALEPEWEAKFEPCSYGFRPGRNCHDAIVRIQLSAQANKKKRWVLDADIKGAFDNIQHETIIESCERFPAKKLLKAWLKAGFMEEERKVKTELGTPQRGVISPLLANIALHGMEQAVGITYQKRSGTHTVKGKKVLIRYADDFVILTENEEDAKQAKSEITQWLTRRGLTLSEEKTKICPLTEGFDFLGFNVKLYPTPETRTGYKLLIKPSKKSVKDLRLKIKRICGKLNGNNAETLVANLNPIIRGWGNYFKIGVSKVVFNKLDYWIYRRMYRWTWRAHPHKSWAWRKKTYFGQRQEGRNDQWVFGGTKGYLTKFSWIPIKRHVIVKYDASLDDPTLKEYWERRNQRKSHTFLTFRLRELARRQKGKCSECRDSLHNGEEIDIHHIIPKSKGGKDILTNLTLIHLYCHKKIHGTRKAIQPA